MKFEFGDLVYSIPESKESTFLDYMQVLAYDQTRQKYKCIVIDRCETIDLMQIVYIREDEIDYARLIDPDAETDYKWDGKPIVPKNFDEYYYEVYDVNGLERKLVRNAIKHFRKEGEIPLLKERRKIEKKK